MAIKQNDINHSRSRVIARHHFGLAMQLFLFFGFLSLAIAACNDRSHGETVDFSNRIPIAKPTTGETTSGSLRVAVHSQVWEYRQQRHPELTQQTRVIMASQQFGNRPMVASRYLDPATRNHIQTVLLPMHQHAGGHQTRSELTGDRFALPQGKWYLPIVEIKTAL